MYKKMVSFAVYSLAVFLAAGLSMLFTVSPLSAASKLTSLTVEPVRQQAPKQVTVRKVSSSQAQIAKQNPGGPLLAPAAGAPCVADLSGDPVWLISGWIIGQEIYKAYQDPELVCPGAYPFTIDTAHILLEITADASLLPLDIPMSVDIELVDTTTEPGCTRPGAQIFLGSPGIVTIPETGIWDISIPLDFPIEVTGPYFVGVRFDSVVTQAMGIQLITDGIETLCVSYNMWDSTIGFIDLGNDSVVYTHAFPPTDPCFNAQPNDPTCFSFDGRLNMWTVGTTGGVVTPDLAVNFLGPQANEVLYGSTDIWVIETSGLGITDSVVFYWGAGDTRNRIGVDANGVIAPPSAGVPGPGRGFSFNWDFSAEAEQSVFIKIELFDALSRSVAESVLVVLEPTPPTPARTTPAYFSRFCDPITASYSLADENLLSWAAIRTPADIEHRKTLGTFDQFQLGDNNGNPNDGNSAANGELGDFYGGPAVGALALEYWFNQGFGQSMQIGGSKLTIQQAADRLGDFMQIPVNGGLEDDWFVFGFQSYLAVTGFSEQKIEFTRDVSYSVLRNWAEEIGGVVMFAVDGVPGRWLAVDGFSGLPTTDNAFRVVVSDPFDATTKFVFWRDTQSGSEVFIGGAWRDVALMTRLLPGNPPPVGRTQFNSGFIPIPSPFSLQLDGAAQNLVDGDFYFFTLEMSDFDGNIGAETVLLRYICSAFKAGDYDGDGLANISDLVFAINFQLFGGPAPVGGAGRADANCNGGVETSDLHHYVFWLFTGGPAPCQ